MILVLTVCSPGLLAITKLMAKILITVPPNQLLQSGNSVTADRWATMLRRQKHQVTIQEASADFGQSYDALVGMHAKHSADAISAMRQQFPQTKVVLVMTGTDLYRDLNASRVPNRSMRLADRIVVLQDQAIRELPEDMRHKACVIFQSATRLKSPVRPLKGCFEVSVCANLRSVKDPFRTELASRQLPSESRIRISHSGFALTESMSETALRSAKKNPRYRWLGGLPRWKARRLVARSKALVVSSKMEGGANVISEALISGVPVLASHVSGNIGMLGERYSGYFPYQDTQRLSELLRRIEFQPAFLKQLTSECKQRSKLFAAAHESTHLRQLLSELGFK